MDQIAANPGSTAPIPPPPRRQPLTRTTATGPAQQPRPKHAFASTSPTTAGHGPLLIRHRPDRVLTAGAENRQQHRANTRSQRTRPRNRVNQSTSRGSQPDSTSLPPQLFARSGDRPRLPQCRPSGQVAGASAFALADAGGEVRAGRPPADRSFVIADAIQALPRTSASTRLLAESEQAPGGVAATSRSTPKTERGRLAAHDRGRC